MSVSDSAWQGPYLSWVSRNAIPAAQPPASPAPAQPPDSRSTTYLAGTARPSQRGLDPHYVFGPDMFDRLIDTVCLEYDIELEWEETDLAIAAQPQLFQRWALAAFEVACTRELWNMYGNAADSIHEMLASSRVDDSRGLAEQMVETLRVCEELEGSYRRLKHEVAALTTKLQARAGCLVYRTDQPTVAPEPTAAP